MPKLSKETQLDRWLDTFEEWSAEDQDGALRILQTMTRRRERKAPAQPLTVAKALTDLDEAMESAKANLAAQGKLPGSEETTNVE